MIPSKNLVKKSIIFDKRRLKGLQITCPFRSKIGSTANQWKNSISLVMWCYCHMIVNDLVSNFFIGWQLSPFYDPILLRNGHIIWKHIFNCNLAIFHDFGDQLRVYLNIQAIYSQTYRYTDGHSFIQWRSHSNCHAPRTASTTQQ